MNILEHLPNDWKIVKLGDIAKIKTGKTNVQDAVDDGPYPLFDRSVAVKRSNKYLFDTEAVIVPGEGAEFVPKYYNGKFDLHQRAYAIYDFHGCDGKYVYYSVEFFKSQLIKASVGSTVISLRLPHFQNFTIPCPPLPEQRKISEILETVDRAIEKTDAIIEKYKRIKQGLMQDLLTRGIDESGKIRSEETHRFKDSPLGRIPEEWDLYLLKSVTIFIKDGTHATYKDVDEGVYLLSAKDVHNGRILFPEDSRKISYRDYLEIMKNYNFLTGDILLTIVGTIGRVAYISGDEPKFALQRSVAIIRFLREKVVSKYAYYFLQSNQFQKQLENSINALAQGGVYLNALENLQIVIPKSMQEQKRIAEILSQIDAVIEKEEKYKEKLERLKRGLMEDLLTGRVRVTQLLNEEVG